MEGHDVLLQPPGIVSNQLAYDGEGGHADLAGVYIIAINMMPSIASSGTRAIQSKSNKQSRPGSVLEVFSIHLRPSIITEFSDRC